MPTSIRRKDSHSQMYNTWIISSLTMNVYRHVLVEQHHHLLLVEAEARLH